MSVDMEGTMVEIGHKQETIEPAFPDEVAAVAAVRQEFAANGQDAVTWGRASGNFQVGQVSVAEFSPTYLCTESCPGCPDSNLLRQETNRQRKERGEEPLHEEKAETEAMLVRIRQLK